MLKFKDCYFDILLLFQLSTFSLLAVPYWITSMWRNPSGWLTLARKTKISGLIIVTWQGQGQGNVYKGICALTVCCLIPLSCCLNEYN